MENFLKKEGTCLFFEPPRENSFNSTDLTSNSDAKKQIN